ncbi:YigZ family protein [Oleiagrimonas sp. C23AA]|uniref:IMPACT family protein n=1 Tax=Oleiagrimonas sp. C23AA TaxID=2719047 RepID=UPI0014242FCD|nr:YigZ family protein [Oleiagrimonas sp. C23AA]NII10533.1 YigZ family protein [Oleiagrimonas sp. C23AA]
MTDLYQLTAPATYSEEIKKSRFLVHARSVSTPAQALEVLQEVSDATANHDCWAYRIGQDYRFNDDGEPSGTAGKPILAAIDGQQLDGVMVVVTRWFGGIKLGAGGLIRAYGGTAAECLRRADKQIVVPRVRLGFEIGFAELHVLKARIADWDAPIEQETYGAAGVEVTLALPVRHREALEQLLADLSRGAASVRELDAP